MNFQQETTEALTPQQRRAHTNTTWAHMGYACVGEVASGYGLGRVWGVLRRVEDLRLLPVAAASLDLSGMIPYAYGLLDNTTIC